MVIVSAFYLWTKFDDIPTTKGRLLSKIMSILFAEIIIVIAVTFFWTILCLDLGEFGTAIMMLLLLLNIAGSAGIVSISLIGLIIYKYIKRQKKL